MIDQTEDVGFVPLVPPRLPIRKKRVRRDVERGVYNQPIRRADNVMRRT
jgi:hypothetical protein